MVRTPSMSAVPHPQQLLQSAADEASQERGLNPVSPVQEPIPVQPSVAPAKAEFANPQHAQTAMLANAHALEPQPLSAQTLYRQAPVIQRRAEGAEPYDLTSPPPAQQASYLDEFFDLSALPDAAPVSQVTEAYDKTRGLFGAPNQKFGRY
jgi:hypothetical protein